MSNIRSGSEELTEYLRRRTASDSEQERIILAVCTAYNVTRAIMRSPDRGQHLTEARHVAMFLLSRLGHLSSSRIAGLFDRKNHTTVLHAVGKIDKQMGRKAFAASVQSIVEACT